MLARFVHVTTSGVFILLIMYTSSVPLGINNSM